MAAEIALDFAVAMAPDQHRHQHVLGNCRFMAEGVADRDAARQGREVDQFDAGGHRLNEPDVRRRGIFRTPVISDDDVGIGRSLGRLHELLRIGEDLDTQAGRQFGRDASGGIGGDIAKEQCFHVMVCAQGKTARTVMLSGCLRNASAPRGLIL